MRVWGRRGAQGGLGGLFLDCIKLPQCSFDGRGELGYGQLGDRSDGRDAMPKTRQHDLRQCTLYGTCAKVYEVCTICD